MEEKIEQIKKKSHVSQIKELNLDNSYGIPRFHLLEEFTNLESLSIKNSGINNLRGFPKLTNLRKLDLTGNNISGALHPLQSCPNLTHLNLSGNSIRSISALRPLSDLKNLQSLLLVNCSVTKQEDYRNKVFNTLSSLQDLDGENKQGIADVASLRIAKSMNQVKDVTTDKVALTNDKKPDSTSNKENTDLSDQKESNNNLQAKNESSDEKMEVDNQSQKMETNADDDKQTKGKKRPSKGNGPSPRKKKKSMNAYVCKNPLMQLNELKPGLQYIVESQSGPPHDPIFVVSVQVNDQKYIGRGNSKQLAKHAAAQAALSSFIQFKDNTSDIMNSMCRNNNIPDFTADSEESEGFNKFEIHHNGAGNEVLISSGGQVFKKPLKILTEADKKNPVMLLNELHPGLSFKLEEENSAVPSQRFRMTVEIDGETFEGTGQNKKLAKSAAARAALSKLFNITYNLYPSLTSTNIIDNDLFNFPQNVADKIAHSVMNTFNETMADNPENAKWKILAGIAMTKNENMEEIEVISFGTGTKCINGEHISMNGATLNDCHAEIISRRCLKDFFYKELEKHLEGLAQESIFMKKENGPGFCIKPHVKFHLYISTAPCGDARIFAPHGEGPEAIDRHPNRKARGVLRTKIESGEGTIPVKQGQIIQTWDGIITGQERLLTMSCSDKIASWNVVGLQGALLGFFVEPIYLDSVILGGLFHFDHLCRALFGRIENIIKELPPLFKLNKPKMSALTSPETRHLVKSPNFSVNWTTGLGRAEVVNAITGKTKDNQISRLSKKSFFQRFMNLYGKLPSRVDAPAAKLPLYVNMKNLVKDYQQAKEIFATAFKEAGLGNWVKKPQEQNEFELTF